jgi:hypothetical protein
VGSLKSLISGGGRGDVETDAILISKRSECDGCLNSVASDGRGRARGAAAAWPDD